MGGKHAAPDRRRLYRDMLRLALYLAVVFVVGVGGSVLLGSFLGASDDVIPVAATSQTDTTTSVLSLTLATESVATTSTTVATTTTTSPPPTITTLPPVRSPSEISAIVLNSTSTKGMAGQLSARIGELGYQMLEPDNYSPRLDVSVIWFVAGFDREAQALAELIPDATIEPFPGDDAQSDITVVLGASFSE